METSTFAREMPSGRRALRLTLTVCATVAGFVSLLMAVHIAADVTSRNVTGTPLPATLEMTKNWSMVLIIMLAMGYTELSGEHIRATIFSQRLSPQAHWRSEITVRVVALVVVLALTYYSMLAAVFSVGVDQVAVGAVPIPIWPIKILLVLGFVLFGLQLLVSIIDLVKKCPGTADDSDS